MENNVLDYLHNVLEKSKDSINAALTAGGAKDFPEYREMCGRLHGLSQAQREIKELAEKMERSPD